MENPCPVTVDQGVAAVVSMGLAVAGMTGSAGPVTQAVAAGDTVYSGATVGNVVLGRQPASRKEDVMQPSASNMHAAHRPLRPKDEG